MNNNAKTLSVAAPQPAVSPIEFDTYNPNAKRGQRIHYGNRRDDNAERVQPAERSHDLRKGDLVNIRYKEIDGMYIAEVINITNC